MCQKAKGVITRDSVLNRNTAGRGLLCCRGARELCRARRIKKQYCGSQGVVSCRSVSQHILLGNTNVNVYTRVPVQVYAYVLDVNQRTVNVSSHNFLA